MELYTRIKRDLFAILVGFAIIGLLLNYFSIGIDDTDKDGFNRSGFRLMTDYGTGKEYLYKSGIIIERVK